MESIALVLMLVLNIWMALCSSPLPIVKQDIDFLIVNGIKVSLAEEFINYTKHHRKNYSSHEEFLFRANIYGRNKQFVDILNTFDQNAEYSILHSPFSDLTSSEFQYKHLMNSKEQKFYKEQHGTDDDMQRYISTLLSIHKQNPSAYNTRQSHSLRNDPNIVFKEVDDVISDEVAEFDWERNGKVTSVKNQGSIGTCWAFSAVGVLETQVAIKKNKLINLSVEQLVECAATENKTTGDADCSEFGGWPYLGYEYIQSYGGIYTEEEFPYCSGTIDPKNLMPLCFPCMPKAYDKVYCGDHSDLYCNSSSTLGQKRGGLCSRKPTSALNKLTKVSYWKKLSTNETTLKEELKQSGTISVALNAILLQFYFRGVISLPFCPTEANHAVLLVGYGVEPKKWFRPLSKELPYWRVKNSWGGSWGENGYFRIKRDSGLCGINLSPSIAFIE